MPCSNGTPVDDVEQGISLSDEGEALSRKLCVARIEPVDLGLDVEVLSLNALCCGMWAKRPHVEGPATKNGNA